MDLTCVPIIVICSYMIGEIYKVIFKRKKEVFKIIPILVAISGGLLGILIYITNKEMIFNVDNAWIAFCIGITSGASATSANQIIKQIFIKSEN